VLYYIKVTKFVKLAQFCLFKDIHVLDYIKVTMLVKLTYFGIFTEFCAI